MYKFFGVLCILILFYVNLSAKQKHITVWNYYLSPPFMISHDQGLVYDFVDLLNSEQNKYVFHLKSIPRAQLNKLLEQKKQGVVLFVNWTWMGKNAKEKYYWTSPILKDQNEVISSVNKKVIYLSPNSLKGLVFGAIRGRKYKGLEKYFKTGEITRYNVDNEKQVLSMILKNRVDVTSQPRTIVMSLSSKMDIEKQLYFSPTALFSFNRHLMVTKELDYIHEFLNNFTVSLSSSEKWQNILNRYNLK